MKPDRVTPSKFYRETRTPNFHWNEHVVATSEDFRVKTRPKIQREFIHAETCANGYMCQRVHYKGQSRALVAGTQPQGYAGTGSRNIAKNKRPSRPKPQYLVSAKLTRERRHYKEKTTPFRQTSTPPIKHKDDKWDYTSKRNTSRYRRVMRQPGQTHQKAQATRGNEVRTDNNTTKEGYAWGKQT